MMFGNRVNSKPVCRAQSNLVIEFVTLEVGGLSG